MALLGDTLLEDKSGCLGWSCNRTPRPGLLASMPAPTPPHPSLLRAGGWVQARSPRRLPRTSGLALVFSEVWSPKGLSFGVLKKRQGHRDVLEWLGKGTLASK